MEKLTVKVKSLDPRAKIPEYKHDGDSGADLSATHGRCIYPGYFGMIKTGLTVEIPPGYEGQVRSRSGLAAKKGVFVLNSPGTIDSNYRGEVCVILFNAGEEPFLVEQGDRIAQLVIAPVVTANFETVSDINGESSRGEGGFGSSGVK